MAQARAIIAQLTAAQGNRNTTSTDADFNGGSIAKPNRLVSVGKAIANAPIEVFMTELKTKLAEAEASKADALSRFDVEATKLANAAIEVAR